MQRAKFRLLAEMLLAIQLRRVSGFCVRVGGRVFALGDPPVGDLDCLRLQAVPVPGLELPSCALDLHPAPGRAMCLVPPGTSDSDVIVAAAAAASGKVYPTGLHNTSNLSGAVQAAMQRLAAEAAQQAAEGPTEEIQQDAEGYAEGTVWVALGAMLAAVALVVGVAAARATAPTRMQKHLLDQAIEEDSYMEYTNK